MRPVKDILREEYWNIAYRLCGEGDTLLDGNAASFSVLPESKRYWYADPFLFEYCGKIYLFVEMFDNVTEKGLVGVSVLGEKGFSVPEVVLILSDTDGLGIYFYKLCEGVLKSSCYGDCRTQRNVEFGEFLRAEL